MTIPIGTIIASYQIVSQIAPGGQATVYRARHISLQREVALKILHPHLITEPDFVQKFTQEGQLLARLKHPNIVNVYNAGYDPATGSYFIEMELLNGVDLETLITQQGKLAVDVVVNVATQVAATLEYAHAQNLIHRDIKPGNIMQLSDGSIKVLDFGIAAIVAAGQKAKTSIGTWEYVAPEQANGNADARSDIYSLGATLYHCLTGQHPPMLAAQPPTPLRQLNATVSPALENVILKMLSTDPAKRQQTARECILEIENAIRVPSNECPYCHETNRVGAKHCAICGQIIAGYTSGLKLGMSWANRYLLRFVEPITKPWHVEMFHAYDTQTGSNCWILPMGSDQSENRWMFDFAKLQCIAQIEVI